MCPYLGKCNSCDKYLDCPYDHFGDGSPICKEFRCGEVPCYQLECISDEEYLGLFSDN